MSSAAAALRLRALPAKILPANTVGEVAFTVSAYTFPTFRAIGYGPEFPAGGLHPLQLAPSEAIYGQNPWLDRS